MAGPFKTIRVKGKRLRFNWDATLEDSANWAEFDIDKFCVDMAHTESLDDMKEAALHETIHAACPLIPESHVREISEQMFAVLRDNKRFTQWILEESRDDE